MPMLAGYQIQETIFRNSYTQVFRALRESDGKRVILRTSSENVSSSQNARLKYIADVLKKFDHRNISKLYDWIEHPSQCWLIMEDIQALDLSLYLQRFDQQRLPMEIFWPIAKQLAEALSLVHHEQVIHKDLHPRNIVVNPETLQCQIIDFGLASLLSREQPTLTAPDNLEGSLSYLSPEQTGRMNRSLDYRTDFYTLGATLYQALTGHVPFVADDALGLVYAHMAITQKPAIEVRPTIPEALSRIIDKLLSKNAEDRYQSAQGLKYDLEAVHALSKKNSDTHEFQLGTEDVSNYFLIPQNLYGREQETALLMQHFKDASQGESSLLVVNGQAGIGKSALVHEIHQPIAEHGGLFIEGKFDQYHQHLPYSALRMAFNSWLNQVLSLSEDVLDHLKRRLLDRLEANARVLIDFVPAFELLLGDLNEAPKLEAKENQIRFQLVMKQFIQVATSDRPLVLFLDDLQWADRGSLDLLPSLLEEDGHFLVIVACRDNEINDAHPVRRMLERLAACNGKQDFKKLNQIMLGPLKEDQLNVLLCATLSRLEVDTYPLAALIFGKTQGNPFFVKEFLKRLYGQGLLRFDLTQSSWHWDMKAIEDEEITDNVVAFILQKMEGLSQETTTLLRIASCVGSRFPIKLLAMLSQQTEEQVIQALWPALEEGILLQEGGSGLFSGGVSSRASYGQPISNEVLSTHAYSSPARSNSQLRTDNRFSGTLFCRFSHDRMLQATYESIPEPERPALHLHVGRLMLSEASLNPYASHDFVDEVASSLNEASLFNIVEQMNYGLELLEEDAERLLLARLNRLVADKALQAGVWNSAKRVSGIGLSLLPEEAWQSHYDLTLNLYRVNAESEYLLGDIELADNIYQTILESVSDSLVKAEIYSHRLVQCIGSGRWLEGEQLGQAGLESLGIDVSNTFMNQDELHQAMEAQLKRMDIPDYLRRVETLPEDLDARHELALYLAANMSLVNAVFGKMDDAFFYCFLGLKFLNKEKVSQATHLIFGVLSMIGFTTGLYKWSKYAGQIALGLMARFPEARERSNCTNLVAGSSYSLWASYKDVISLHEEGERIGLSNGELARAAINRMNKIFVLSVAGEPLHENHIFAKELQASTNPMIAFSAIPCVYHKFLESLINPSDAHALDEENMPEGFVARIKGTVHDFYWQHSRAVLAFWYDEYELAIHLISHYRQAAGITINWKIDYEISFLLLRTQFPSKFSQEKLHEARTLETRLRTMADIFPKNYMHMVSLLDAEKARFDNESPEVCMRLYEQAISLSNDNGFVQWHAYANERIASYFEDLGFQRYSRLHAELAFRSYSSWGCGVKVERLIDRYSYLGGLGEDSSYASDHYGSQDGSHHTSSRSPRVDLDIASVMKSAQAISGELELDQLIAKVMDVIMENVGAQKGVFVLMEGRRLANEQSKYPMIEAFIDLPEKQRVVMQHEALSEARSVPISIIRYCLRSGEVVNLSNAMMKGEYCNDHYIRDRQCKSILCVPILYRDERIGVLYLENNLSIGAFDQRRLELVTMLLAQAATAFENARLYADVSELNISLEKKVEERTRELELANEELKAFNYTVSHDLRSPLRTLTEYSQIMLDDYAEQLEDDASFLLKRMNKSASKMSGLVAGLLDLSRLQSKQLERESVSLSVMASEIIEAFQEAEPKRSLRVQITPDMVVQADKRMMNSVLENLLGNAWKYSGKKDVVEIEFGVSSKRGRRVFFVRDQGAGFDMRYANNLFSTFQRLHHEKEFSGTGIGLATVKRIINRHGGDIWAEAEVDKGATFYFTLGGSD